MGIDDLDKSWWERKVSEPYLKKHYEKLPYLTAPTEYIGGGISDFITEKTPDLWGHYFGKDSEYKNFEDLYGVYPMLEDAAKEAVNLGYEVADYGADIGLNTATLAANLPAYAYNAASVPHNLAADYFGIEGLRNEPIGRPFWSNAAGTWLKDTAQDATGMGGTGMRDESKKYHTAYQPPALTDPEGNILRDDEGRGTADHDLGKWNLYQDWKTGSGTDFRALEREALEASNKYVDQWVKGEGSVQNLMKDFNENFWEPLGENEKNYYDKNKMFSNFYNYQLDYTKDFEKNKYELSKTGDDFGKWMSQKYQNEMVSKYGRYELADFDNAVDNMDYMSRNISPFGDEASVNFNLANEDYISAMKSGKMVSEIGAPNEFDYGAFDREKGVGINKWAGWEPFEHENEAVKKYYESGPVLAAELLAAGRWTQAPQKITRALSKGKKGRFARELLPGLLQNQEGFGILSMPKNFGFKFKDNKGAKRVANWMLNTTNYLRPKGGQAYFALQSGELGRD